MLARKIVEIAVSSEQNCDASVDQKEDGPNQCARKRRGADGRLSKCWHCREGLAGDYAPGAAGALDGRRRACRYADGQSRNAKLRSKIRLRPRTLNLLQFSIRIRSTQVNPLAR